jgi:hypothetical protein
VDRFSKNADVLNFIKIRPVGAEVFYADRQTDGGTVGSRYRKPDRQTDRETGMAKLIVPFPNFANARNNESVEYEGN